MGSVKRIIVIIKLIELLIAVICVSLHRQSYTLDFDVDAIAALAFGGYIIIIVGELAARFLGKQFDKRIDIYFSVIGCILFTATGAMGIRYFHQDGIYIDREQTLAKGSLAIIGGALFLVDAVLAWRED